MNGRFSSAFQRSRPAVSRWIQELLRIVLLSARGLKENRIFSQAAALSYGTLMALGPMVAITVMVSTTFIRTDAETQIKNLLVFVAPNLQEYMNMEDQVPGTAEGEMASALDTLISQIVNGAEALFSQVNTSGTAAFGIIGVLLLIFIVIQLLTAVETNLNRIWGVHQGRPWAQRIVFYWTLVTLGAILGLAATVLFTTSNLIKAFEGIPLGHTLTGFLIFLGPWVSVLLLSLILCFFYMFFPHTKVHLRAALVGGVATTLLLLFNQYLSILYVQRMISIQSLYGSVGIIPVIMLGVYVFWILILLGAQLTYTVQNREFLGFEAAWNRLSHASREALGLVVLLHLSRAFVENRAPPTSADIAEHLQLPLNVINECLTTLRRLHWVRVVQLEDEHGLANEEAYLPSRPVDQLDVRRFSNALDSMGEDFALEDVLRKEPSLEILYRERAKERTPLTLHDLIHGLDHEVGP